MCIASCTTRLTVRDCHHNTCEYLCCLYVSLPPTQLASKAGYLVKMGGKVKVHSQCLCFSELAELCTELEKEVVRTQRQTLVLLCKGNCKF